MATSYKKKGAKSKKRTKSGNGRTVAKVGGAPKKLLVGIVDLDQDPPIIIKPGGSLDITVQNNETSNNKLVDKGIGSDGHYRYEHNHTEKEYKLKNLRFLDVASGKLTDVELPSKEYAILLYYFK